MAFLINNIHVNKPLSEFALSYIQDEASFIATKVSQPIPSKKSSDLYYTFGRTNWQQAEDERSPGAKPNWVTTPQPSTSAFLINDHAYRVLVTDEEINDADEPLTPKQDASAFCVEKLMIMQEVRAALAIMTTTGSNSGVTLTAANQWNATTTVTPLNDIDTGSQAILTATGKRGNFGVTNDAVQSILKRQSQLLGLIQYTRGGLNVTNEILAAAMDLDALYIGKSNQMTTGEGIASQATAQIWVDNFFIGYNPPKPSKKVLTHSHFFVPSDSAGGQVSIEEFDERKRHSIEIHAHLPYDHVVVSTLAGYLISDVLV